jgi:hypothetical protein
MASRTLILVALVACHAQMNDLPDDSGAPDDGASSSDSSFDHTAEPAYSPLAITFPTAVAENHRARFAYPGLPYELQIGAVGGSFPYSYKLDSAPADMIIDAAGVATWTNPLSNASVTVRVTDSLGTSTTATWTIAVDAARFKFIDAAAPVGGTGSRTTPWRSLADAFMGSTERDIFYLRAGTYTLLGLPISGTGAEQRIDWNTRDGRGTQFVGYPGDPRPVIDFGYTGAVERPRIWFQSDVIYLDGIEIRNIYTVGLHLSRSDGHGVVIRRSRFAHSGPGINGTNSAFLLFPRGRSTNDMIVDCEFTDTPADATGNIAIKAYDTTRMLVARSRFHHGNGSTEAWVAMKGGVSQFTFRENHIYDIEGLGVGGNMANSDEPDFIPTSGEIAYNFFDCEAANTSEGVGPIAIKQHGDALGAMHSYRNTYRGSPTVRWLDTGDGPVTFRHDVIVSVNAAAQPWPHILDVDVSAPTILSLDENLTGATDDGIINADGLLTGEARTMFLGARGHELP